MMLFLALVSMLTVSAFCVTFNNHLGIRQCQQRCRRIGECMSMEFDARRLLCSVRIDTSEKILILAQSVHWDFHGLRTDCQTCRKMEACVGKQKKACVALGKRSPREKIVEMKRAVGSFDGHSGISVPLLGERILTKEAVYTLPKTEFFFWTVHLKFSAQPISDNYIIFMSNMLKNGRVTGGSVELAIVNYRPTLAVQGKTVERKTLPGRVKYGLVYVYRKGHNRLGLVSFDRSQVDMEKPSVDRYILDAPDIVSEDNGDFLIKQQFQINKQPWNYQDVLYIFLAKYDLNAFPPYVIKEINMLKRKL